MTNHNSLDIEAVLARRHDNGADYWATADGRLGVGEPFSTLTALLILHELRVSRNHEATRGAIELILRTWRADGRYRLTPSGSLYPCSTAAAARVLCRFGLSNDPRLQRTFEHFRESQHTDGGWRCNKFPYGRGPETELSNPGVTLAVLDCFRFNDGYRSDRCLDRAVESLLRHWVVRRPTGPCHFGIGSLFMLLEYPFLRYNLFYYVYVLSFYSGAKADHRFRDALRVLESKLDSHGRVVIEHPHRKLEGFRLCSKGQPSTLATARYRQIVTNLQA